MYLVFIFSSYRYWFFGLFLLLCPTYGLPFIWSTKGKLWNGSRKIVAPVVYGLIDLYEVVKTENSFSAADITFSMILRSMFRSLLPVGWYCPLPPLHTFNAPCFWKLAKSVRKMLLSEYNCCCSCCCCWYVFPKAPPKKKKWQETNVLAALFSYIYHI